jgi:hypothetical protein
METMPNALIKDLLSTGYFYEDLKTYTEAKEINLSVYSRNYAIPYLTKMLVSYESSGQIDRSEILNLAVNCLINVKDEELVDSIIELKKLTHTEIDINERALHQIDSSDKSGLRTCRRKSQSAQTLSKFLVSIIKMFKLAEATPPKRSAGKSLGDADKNAQEVPVLIG